MKHSCQKTKVPVQQRYTRSIDLLVRVVSNGPMTRCTSCNGIIAKTDLECYTCREPIPGKPRRTKYSLLRFWAKPDTSALKDFMAQEKATPGEQGAF